MQSMFYWVVNYTVLKNASEMSFRPPIDPTQMFLVRCNTKQNPTLYYIDLLLMFSHKA